MASPVKVTKDNTKAFMAALTALAENRVYAGIPATTAGRKEEDEPLNNAEIMFIHEFGSPEANIPARPVVYPAIKNAQGKLTAALSATAKAAFTGGSTAVMKGFDAVGLLAQNAMRTRISTGPFAPLSPRTIAQRAAKRGTKRRKGEVEYMKAIKDGMSPVEAQAASGIKPLIDTGSLRRALTYVIRKVKWTGKKAKL